LKIAYEVESNGGGIGEIRIFHNGKLIQSDGYYRETKRPTADKVVLASYSGEMIREEMRGLVVVAKQEGKASMIDAPPKGNVFKGVITVSAIPGENEVSIAAFNKDNTVQSMLKTVTFNSTVKPEDPHIYVLSIGIDKYKSPKDNLKFAVKDAESIARMIKKESLTQYKENKVHVTVLKNQSATKTNIIKEINELSRVVKPNDVFILFIAGHGVLHGGLYSIVTHDFDGNLSKDNLISSNEIMEF